MIKKHKAKYPFQNLQLENLSGERWESVPGFDGAYEVSNFGRIKSLRRWRAAGSSGQGYYTKEIIRKQGVWRSNNKFIKGHTYHITITLKRDCIKTSTTTARYIYYTFVKPFDIENKNIIISYKDSDGRNQHYKNLFLTDRSKLAKRTYELNRTQPPTEKIPVNQYTIEGILVAAYPSITEASRVTGFHLTGIMACMLNNIHQHRGYVWQYASKLASENVSANNNNNCGIVFNEHLWKMLGKPETSKTNPIPILNLSSKNLWGEKWQKIEGLGGIYLISNLGRIKSISRLSTGKLAVWKKGQVKKLFSDGSKEQKPSCLLSSFSHDGKKFQMSVARLVYYHFIKRFQLSDKKTTIRYKDGTCYNICARNLILV